MIRRASAHPRELRALQEERDALVRYVLEQSGVLADGESFERLKGLDGVGLVARLEGGERPLGREELEGLCRTHENRTGAGVESVAESVAAGELPGHELDLAAYEVAVLHWVSTDVTDLSVHRQYVLQSLCRAVGITRREASHIEALAQSAKELERDFEDGGVPNRSSLEYRLFLCRPELVSAALGTGEQAGMAPSEVLAWISRQLALVGIGVNNLLEGARRALPPPPPLETGGTPRLALPVEPCVQALDGLLDVARSWLQPAGGACEFPESDYEPSWNSALEALHARVRDVMRGLGLLGGQASLPIPGPLSAKIAGSLLCTVVVVDPLADEPESDDEEDEEDEEDEDAETPRPQRRRGSDADAATSEEREEDIVRWDETPTPRRRGDSDSDSLPPDQAGAQSAGEAGDELQSECASREDRFSQLLGLLPPSGERQGVAQRLSGSTSAGSCFTRDAAALWFGTSGELSAPLVINSDIGEGQAEERRGLTGRDRNGDGLSTICSEQLQLSQATQVAVVGGLLLRDWEVTRDDTVRSGLCAVSERIATTHAAGGGGDGGDSSEVGFEQEFQGSVLRMLDGITRNIIVETLCLGSCDDNDTVQARREGCSHTDIAWAVELHLHIGSAIAGQRNLGIFERLVTDVATTFYANTITTLSADGGGLLDARRLHEGFGAVMDDIEDMLSFVIQMLGPLIERVLREQQHYPQTDVNEDEERRLAVEGTVEADDVIEQMFLLAMSNILGAAYRSCSVVDDAARPLEGPLDEDCRKALQMLSKISEYFGELCPGSEPILDHNAPSRSPLTQLILNWLTDRQALMTQAAERYVESEDWQPVADGRPWSSSCCLVFEMLQESIDQFFSFAPHVPAVQDFCVMLLQHCCECVKHYTWVLRQGTVENVSRSQPQRERAPTITRVLEAQHSVGNDTNSDGGGGSSPADEGLQLDSPSGPRLEQQTITTLHNLSEVKGQFFEKMWHHFAESWRLWRKKTFREGRGEGPENQLRKRFAARTVESMRTEADQNAEYAILDTVKAVGQQMVYKLLRQYFFTDLYAPRYWKARRQALRQRSQAATRLRAAKQESEAQAGQQKSADAERGSPKITEAKLALQQVECAVEGAINGPGSLHYALQKGDELLNSSVTGEGSAEEAAPVLAALAASLGSAALRAWEHVVFSEDTEKGTERRLFGGDAHEVLATDLNSLVQFLYDTVRAQHTVGPMGRSRDQDETLSPPPRHAEESGGAKVELSRDTTRTITRLQGQMCLLGVDTPTLVTWYNTRLQDDNAPIDGAPAEATANVILRVLAHRDDALAQASARTAKSGLDGSMQHIVAAEDAGPSDPTRSTSSRVLGWIGIMSGAAEPAPEPSTGD